MMEYPYQNSLVLTDSIFVMLGGQIGTSTSQQREVAYILAEEQMTEHLRTFLVPTIVSGSIFYKKDTLFETEYGHVRRILSASVEIVNQLSPLQTTIYTGSALIRNSEYGYLDVFAPCQYGGNWIYKASAVYESGFNSGTVTQPTLRLALTLAAQIALNFMDISLSNEGVGDVGIQKFNNQSYSETRTYLANTVFGNSAVAQKIKSLTRKYRSRPAVSLH